MSQRTAIHCIVSRPTISADIYNAQKSISSFKTITQIMDEVDGMKTTKPFKEALSHHIGICNNFEKTVISLLEQKLPIFPGMTITTEGGQRTARIEDMRYHYDAKFKGFVFQIFMNETNNQL